MGLKEVHPPKWADRFLQWYCHPDLIEEIQGDVYEMFYRKVSDNKNVAKVQFIWNVLTILSTEEYQKTKKELSLLQLQSFYVQKLFCLRVCEILRAT